MDDTKAMPSIPGTVATRAMTMKRMRLPWWSESAERTTAPMMPASSIRPPITPASVGLARREPVRRDLGPRVEQKRLGDGDADGAEQHQRVVRADQAAGDAEHGHQHDAEADGDAEATRVDDPRSRQREGDEGDHERHRQGSDRQ